MQALCDAMHDTTDKISTESSQRCYLWINSRELCNGNIGCVIDMELFILILINRARRERTQVYLNLLETRILALHLHIDPPGCSKTAKRILQAVRKGFNM